MKIKEALYAPKTKDTEYFEAELNQIGHEK
jgi:hypothetical protein